MFISKTAFSVLPKLVETRPIQQTQMKIPAELNVLWEFKSNKLARNSPGLVADWRRAEGFIGIEIPRVFTESQPVADAVKAELMILRQADV